MYSLHMVLSCTNLSIQSSGYTSSPLAISNFTQPVSQEVCLFYNFTHRITPNAPDWLPSLGKLLLRHTHALGADLSLLKSNPWTTTNVNIHVWWAYELSLTFCHPEAFMGIGEQGLAQTQASKECNCWVTGQMYA